MTRIPDIEKLREIALDQHGLITAAQADSIGVSRPSLSYLVKNDRKSNAGYLSYSPNPLYSL